MALVPCRRCRQPFHASCHDASCVNALCPHCEYAEPALDDHLSMEGGRIGEDGAGDVSNALATTRDTVRAHRPRPSAHGGQE